MKKRTYLLSALILCATVQPLAARFSHLHSCNSHHNREFPKDFTPPTPALSESLLIGTGIATAIAGNITKLYGLYIFLSNINFLISGEKIADYTRKELRALSKEDLAVLVAREEKRVKNKQKGLRLFLTGLGIDALGGCILVGGLAKYGFRVEEARQAACKQEAAQASFTPIV